MGEVKNVITVYSERILKYCVLISLTLLCLLFHREAHSYYFRLQLNPQSQIAQQLGTNTLRFHFSSDSWLQNEGEQYAVHECGITDEHDGILTVRNHRDLPPLAMITMYKNTITLFVTHSTSTSFPASEDGRQQVILSMKKHRITNSFQYRAHPLIAFLFRNSDDQIQLKWMASTASERKTAQYYYDSTQSEWSVLETDILEKLPAYKPTLKMPPLLAPSKLWSAAFLSPYPKENAIEASATPMMSSLNLKDDSSLIPTPPPPSLPDEIKQNEMAASLYGGPGEGGFDNDLQFSFLSTITNEATATASAPAVPSQKLLTLLPATKKNADKLNPLIEEINSASPQAAYDRQQVPLPKANKSLPRLDLTKG